MAIREIKNDLLDASDGPVTSFVVMYRACKIAKSEDADTVANALYECLENFEEIPSNEFAQSI